MPPLTGYRVLVAGPAGDEWTASMIDYAVETTSRQVGEAPLLGARLDNSLEPPATIARYRDLAERLENIDASIESMEPAFTGDASATGGLETIWNARTNHAVVIDPANLRMRIATRSGNGLPSRWSTFALPAAVPNE